MRKLTAIVAALGLLGTATLTPVLAAPASDGVTKTDFSSAKKKAKKSKHKKMKMKKGMKGMDHSALPASEPSSAKKASSAIVYRVAA